MFDEFSLKFSPVCSNPPFPFWDGNPCCSRPGGPSKRLEGLYSSNRPSAAWLAHQSRNACIASGFMGVNERAISRFSRSTSRESIPLTRITGGRSSWPTAGVGKTSFAAIAAPTTLRFFRKRRRSVPSNAFSPLKLVAISSSVNFVPRKPRSSLNLLLSRLVRVQRFLANGFLLSALPLWTLLRAGGMQDDLGPAVVPRVEMFVSLRGFVQSQFVRNNP